MTLIDLELLVGRLSYTDKMPCPSWSIPAQKCKTGAKLVDVAGSVCENCYAMKGRYKFDNVQNALWRRWEAYKADPVTWTERMGEIIRRKKLEYFRWFDSGDLQDEAMLRHIISVARRTPETTHWLPTRETAIVEKVLKTIKKPENLTIRVSANMVDGPPAKTKMNLPTSGVSVKNWTCPAPTRSNQCGDCRRCWDPEIPLVVYKAH